MAVEEDSGAGNEAPMTYQRYLALDQVLSAQYPLSGAHDEMLFIIIHQASELWMKLAIQELAAARAAIDEDRLRPAFKFLARVARIQQQLTQSWAVLATMTPSEYTAVRPHLGPSSGFESHQYRLLEFIAGERDRAHALRHKGEAQALLLAELARPSLYDAAIALLGRRGFAVPVRDRLEATPAYNPALEDAWRAIYRAPEAHFDLYELAEKLVDFEQAFQQWRFGHVKTVERIIGNKRGTGGTAGVPYLESVLKKRFFPELMAVRTGL